ncbi:MAG: helix-turn-helix transcriptional regulator [Lachnospiraceae bacterium]|nr:helix-turn-helix transcriptional regulator [Lachnospiraceae bacterium]
MDVDALPIILYNRSSRNVVWSSRKEEEVGTVNTQLATNNIAEKGEMGMTIKEFRLSQKLSQPKLAKALGIGVSTVGAYEVGKIKPSKKVYAKIKEVFGVDISEAAVEAAAVDTAPTPAPVETAPTVETTPAVEKKVEAEAAPAPAKKQRKAKKTTPAPAVEEKVEVEATAEAAPTPAKKTRKTKANKEKAEAAPVEATPAPAPVVEEKVEPAPAPAPAKKTRAKKEKVEVKAEAAPAPAKKPRKSKKEKVEDEAAPTPAKKTRARKGTPAPAKNTSIVIQSPMGGEITTEDILAKVGDVDKVYVRVDQNAIYWVKGENSGAVNIW